MHRLHLVLLGHQGHRLAHDLHALLNELVQQVGDVAGDGLRLLLLLLGGGELLQGGLHGQHQSDVVIDAEDADWVPVVVPDVDGGGLEDLAVPGLGQVAQVVLQLTALPPQGLQHHMGRAIPHLPAGDLAILNGNDGALRVIGGQVVDHHLAIGSKLAGDPFGQFEQKLQR